MSLSAKNPLPSGLTLRIIAFVALLGSLCLAAFLRFNQLLTTSEVMLYQREYDEGVYAASAQLVSQGHMPYRDFLFVEPPVALYLHAAVLRLNPVAWGDPTTFALARYTTIVAGLVTLLAVAILAKQLGGWMSALLAVELLAIDAFVIEIDRRVMLEPYINALSAIALVCYVRALNHE